MYRSIYTGTCGMLRDIVREDIIANNLANVSTTGFKKDLVVSMEHPSRDTFRYNDRTPSPVPRFTTPSYYIGRLGTGSVINEVFTDHSQGFIRFTDNATDLAIEGRGFFLVDTPQGVRLTRNGAFRFNEEGTLVDQMGNPVLATPVATPLSREIRVLSADGAVTVGRTRITIDPAQTFSITPEGQVAIDGEPQFQILKVEVKEPARSLVKEGGNLYRLTGDEDGYFAEDMIVHQGALEQSNVVAVREMINMIECMRSYEANAKIIQNDDALLNASINSLGRVA